MRKRKVSKQFADFIEKYRMYSPEEGIENWKESLMLEHARAIVRGARVGNSVGDIKEEARFMLNLSILEMADLLLNGYEAELEPYEEAEEIIDGYKSLGYIIDNIKYGETYTSKDETMELFLEDGGDVFIRTVGQFEKKLLASGWARTVKWYKEDTLEPLCFNDALVEFEKSDKEEVVLVTRHKGGIIEWNTRGADDLTVAEIRLLNWYLIPRTDIVRYENRSDM